MVNYTNVINISHKDYLQVMRNVKIFFTEKKRIIDTDSFQRSALILQAMQKLII